MIKAIIFDMDGVISDTQGIHAKIESKILSMNGIKISPEYITKHFAGIKTEVFLKEILKTKNVKADLNYLLKYKWREMRRQVKNIKEIEGAKNLIKYFYKRDYILAVASSSNKKFIKSVLKKLKILKYFKVIISSDEVKNSKPNPEIFLLVSKKLLIQPNNCLVIEDGIAGMKAAKKAKMKCIGLIDNKNHSKYPTNLLVKKLKQINPNFIKKI